MKIKSFGCSFIFGSELTDDGRNLPKGAPSQSTWPALLAQDLGYEYECYARPGSGNLQIQSRLLDAIGVDLEPSLYVVGWTWIDRFDYCNFKNDKWRTITPMDETEESQFYYKNLHSEYRDKITTLIAIKSSIDALKQSNHQFIMTYMDDLIFVSKWHAGPGISSMQEYIRPYLQNFENKNFLDWSHDRGYPIGSKGKHPLEEAHQAAFNLVKSNLDQYIKS